MNRIGIKTKYCCSATHPMTDELMPSYYPYISFEAENSDNFVDVARKQGWKVQGFWIGYDRDDDYLGAINRLNDVIQYWSTSNQVTIERS